MRNQVERNIINCLLLNNCSPPHFSRFLDLSKLETNDSRRYKGRSQAFSERWTKKRVKMSLTASNYKIFCLLYFFYKRNTLFSFTSSKQYLLHSNSDHAVAENVKHLWNHSCSFESALPHETFRKSIGYSKNHNTLFPQV